MKAIGVVFVTVYIFQNLNIMVSFITQYSSGYSFKSEIVHE